MPAKSQAQQSLMAIAANSPEKVNPANKGVLKMKPGSLREFAETSRKGLPKKVKKGKKPVGEGNGPAIW